MTIDPKSPHEPQRHRLITQIIDARYAQRFSVAKLARLSKVQPDQLAKIEAFQVRPGLEVLLRLAEALDMDLMLVPRPYSQSMRAIFKAHTTAHLNDQTKDLLAGFQRCIAPLKRI